MRLQRSFECSRRAKAALEKADMIISGMTLLVKWREAILSRNRQQRKLLLPKPTRQRAIEKYGIEMV